MSGKLKHNLGKINEVELNEVELNEVLDELITNTWIERICEASEKLHKTLHYNGNYGIPNSIAANFRGYN